MRIFLQLASAVCAVVLGLALNCVPLDAASQPVDGDRSTVSVEAVRNHAGGDDTHSDTFVYVPPDGWSIASFAPKVVSTYGDATYTTRLLSSKRLEIPWRTSSRKVKALGVVVDTKTASLNLDVQIQLVRDPVPIAAQAATPAASTQSTVQETSQPSWWSPLSPQMIVAFVFGLIFIIALLVLALRYPEPTDFQYTVFRIVLALSAGGIGAVIPGLINVDVSQGTSFTLRAAGALAVFVVVYFTNPAKLAIRS